MFLSVTPSTLQIIEEPKKLCLCDIHIIYHFKIKTEIVKYFIN